MCGRKSPRLALDPFTGIGPARRLFRALRRFIIEAMRKRAAPPVDPADLPTEAELAATAWHREHHPTSVHNDWWSCRACRTQNPLYADAKNAALTDVFTRIENAMANVKPLRNTHERNPNWYR